MPRMYSRWDAGQLIIYPGSSGPGDEWFVDSTNGLAANTGKDWENALATIDQAVNKCTASNGDVIFVAPFHAENLAADSAVDIDVAGVTVVGVRMGRQMPTLDVTAAAGNCVDDVTTLVGKGKVCACPCKKQAGRLRSSMSGA